MANAQDEIVVEVVEGENLPGTNVYCNLRIVYQSIVLGIKTEEQSTKKRTKTVEVVKSKAKFEESFIFYTYPQERLNSRLVCRVFWKKLTNSRIGQVEIDLNSLPDGDTIDKWFPLTNTALLRIKATYMPANQRLPRLNDAYISYNLSHFVSKEQTSEVPFSDLAVEHNKESPIDFQALSSSIQEFMGISYHTPPVFDEKNIPLPIGWDVLKDEDGADVFINHTTKTATCSDPRTITHDDEKLLSYQSALLLQPKILQHSYKENHKPAYEKRLQKAIKIAERFTLQLRFKRYFWVQIVEARDVNIGNFNSEEMQFYVQINFSDVSEQTKLSPHLQPKWNSNYKFVINSVTGKAPMEFVLYHQDHRVNWFLGAAIIQPGDIPEGKTYSQWLYLSERKILQATAKSKLELDYNQGAPKVQGLLQVWYHLSSLHLDRFFFSLKENSWGTGSFIIKDHLNNSVFSFEGFSSNDFSLQDEHYHRSLVNVKRDPAVSAPTYLITDTSTNGLLMRLTRVMHNKGLAKFRAETANNFITLSGEANPKATSYDMQFQTSNNAVIARIYKRAWRDKNRIFVEVIPTDNLPIFLAAAIIVDIESHKSLE